MILLDFALFPAAVTGDVTWAEACRRSLTVFTYMFLHGGWMHVMRQHAVPVGARRQHRRRDRARCASLSSISCAAWRAGWRMRSPRRNSNVPLVGASGAVAGVVAAYLMLRPCAKIIVLLFGFVPLRLGVRLGARLLGAQRRSGTCSAWTRAIPPGGRMSAGCWPAPCWSSHAPPGTAAVRVHAAGRRAAGADRRLPGPGKRALGIALTVR